MSPEQAEFSGRDVDPRSDIYSLGVLLYELLTSRSPFDPKKLRQAGLDEIRRIIREEEPARPSTHFDTLAAAERTALAKLRGSAPAQLSTQLSGDLDWIVMKSLEKDRARRYDSAGAFAADVQCHLRHEPVAARPPSAAYVCGKFVRRHRLAFAMGALVMVGMIASTAVSVGLLSRARPASAGESSVTEPAKPISEKSLAVLPFKNQSPDASNAFFVDGLHDDILSHLFNIRELVVRSRTSVESFRGTTKGMKAIGAELGVAFILEGSVRRVGTQVHLNAQLIDARTDTPRWGKVFDRELSDIFGLQAELATAIAAELKTVLSPEEKQLLAEKLTDSPEAYDLYLKGRAIMSAAFRSSADDKKAEALFQAAIDKDPAFVAAWADLGLIHGSAYLGNTDHTPERLQKVRKAMEMVVRLAPNSVTAAAVQGRFHYITRGWAKSRQYFEDLARLQPNNPKNAEWKVHIGACCRRMGRFPEAIAAFRRGIALALAHDQEEQKHPHFLIEVLDAGRHYREADEEQLRWLRAHPEDWQQHFDLALRAFYAGRPIREAEALLRAVTEEQGNSAAGLARRQRWAFTTGNLDEFVRLDQASPAPSPGPVFNRSWMGKAFVDLARGDSAAALARMPTRAVFLAKLEQQPENDFALMDLALFEALSGNREAALRYGAEAARLRPESADAWSGPGQSRRRVELYAWTGEKDRAIAELARLLRVPVSGLNIHEMKHAPNYAPLRGDPRFEALLADPKNNAPLF